MLLFISDLHLPDNAGSTPLNLSVLLDRLDQMLTWARDKGVEETTLVLLGDIFELLKSESWLRTSARPWTRGDDAAISIGSPAPPRRRWAGRASVAPRGQKGHPR